MSLHPRTPLHVSLDNAQLPPEPPTSGPLSAPLVEFRRIRDDLQDRVKRGEVTLKVAHETLRAQAESARVQVRSDAEALRQDRHPLSLRLKESLARREAAKNAPSLEDLQRETNRLLSLNLVEQQIVARRQEFESKTLVRTGPTSPPAPTLESLLAFHGKAAAGRDAAGVEWARRQLDAMRTQVLSEQDLKRIEAATDRQDRAHPNIIERYLQALAPTDAPERERFVAEALASADADACVAAYLLARDAAEGIRLRWVRQLSEGLDQFPTAAVEALLTIEEQERERACLALDREVRSATRLLDAESRLNPAIAPSPEEMERRARMESRPVATLGESIGLAALRRGPGPLQVDPSEQEVPHD